MKKGAVLSYLLLILEIVSSIFFTPFLIKNIGDSEYAIYGLAAGISSYIALLDLGVGNALVKYFSKYKINNDVDSQNKLYGLSLFFYLIISLVGIIIGYIIIRFAPYFFNRGLNDFEIRSLQVMLAIVFVNMLISLIENPYKHLILAYEKYALSKILSIIKFVIRMGLSVLVILFGGLGASVLLAQLIATCLILMFEVFYVKKVIKIKPVIKGINRAFIKEIIGYSSFILVQMIATQINSMVDQILISSMVEAATTVLSVYYVGINITHYFQNIGGAINSILMPKAVSLVENKSNKETIERTMINISRIQVMILGIIYAVFIVNGKMFISLWVGESKVRSYYVSLLIMLPMLFYLSQSIGSQVLWALNKHKIQAFLKLGVSIINIGLTALLIKVMDPLIGASLGTCIALLIGDVLVMSIVFKKDIGISITRYYYGQFKGIGTAILISFVLGLLFSKLELSGIFGFFINCAFMSVVYLIQLFLYGFNEEERVFIKKRLLK